MSEVKDGRFDPPEHLSDYSKAVWARVVPHEARSTGRLQGISVALAALDRMEACRQQIEREGQTIKLVTTGKTLPHPLLKIEAAARKEFSTLWAKMHLTFCTKIDGNRCWDRVEAAENTQLTGLPKI